MKLNGNAWKFGDDISTDHIAPGRYFHLRSNLPELAKHVLEDAEPVRMLKDHGRGAVELFRAESAHVGA